jgi:hypothetical protein
MGKTFKPVTLRKTGTVMVMTIPVDIIREYDLKPGDSAYWFSDEPDVIKLKLLRLSDVAEKIALPAA